MTLNKIFNKYVLYVILYGILIALALLPYYSNGSVILGGEGNHFLDFSQVFYKYGYTWQDIDGLPAFSLGMPFAYSFILAPIQRFFSIQFANFIFIFSLFFLPYLSAFLVCRQLRASPFISFLISLFYIVNPFSIYYLWCLNQWTIIPLAVIPLFFWIILRYYNNNFKLFSYFGIASFMFAFANANPPLMVIIQVSLMISVIIAGYYYNRQFSFFNFLQTYILLVLSFILFNIWWIANWFVTLGSAQRIYTMDFALYWLDMVIGNIRAITFKAFTFSYLIPDDTAYNFFSAMYNMAISNIIILIPISIVVFCLFFYHIKTDKYVKKLMLFLFSFWLFLIILIKGSSFPFGFFYKFMYQHVPFFHIFKTPTEKFGVLYIFIFSVLLIFIMNSLKATKYYKRIICLFGFYLFFCSVPIITGNILPDYYLGIYGLNAYASRKYVDKAEYKFFRDKVNKDATDYKILSLPGSRNYQVCLSNDDSKYYTGMDPVLYNLNKPFISASFGPQPLFDNISSKNYDKLLGLYNIKKIMINEDSFPWFRFRERESIPELKDMFNKSMPLEKWGPIYLYDNKSGFLPHIYTSAASIIVNGGADAIVSLLDTKYLAGKPALFFSLQEQNQTLIRREDIPKLVYEKNKWRILKPSASHQLPASSRPEPKITFKKINPAKYLVKAEKAKEPFWLVFSENFHTQWKLYRLPLALARDPSVRGPKVNAEGQATSYRLQDFEEIVADYESLRVKEARHLMKFTPSDIRLLFIKPLDVPHHIVNGYANSWYIDPERLALGEDFVLTVYFWPQSLFYLGLGVSGLTLLGCVGFLAWGWVRRRRI